MAEFLFSSPGHLPNRQTLSLFPHTPKSENPFGRGRSLFYLPVKPDWCFSSPPRGVHLGCNFLYVPHSVVFSRWPKVHPPFFLISQNQLFPQKYRSSPPPRVARFADAGAGLPFRDFSGIGLFPEEEFKALLRPKDAGQGAPFSPFPFRNHGKHLLFPWPGKTQGLFPMPCCQYGIKNYVPFPPLKACINK